MKTEFSVFFFCLKSKLLYFLSIYLLKTQAIFIIIELIRNERR